jgi:hypothetical protein
MILVTVSNTLTTKASLQAGRQLQAMQGNEENQRAERQRFPDLHSAKKRVENIKSNVFFAMWQSHYT